MLVQTIFIGPIIELESYMFRDDLPRDERLSLLNWSKINVKNHPCSLIPGETKKVDIEIPIVPNIFFLREAGFGFGYRFSFSMNQVTPNTVSLIENLNALKDEVEFPLVDWQASPPCSYDDASALQIHTFEFKLRCTAHQIEKSRLSYGFNNSYKGRNSPHQLDSFFYHLRLNCVTSPVRDGLKNIQYNLQLLPFTTLDSLELVIYVRSGLFLVDLGWPEGDHF